MKRTPNTIINRSKSAKSDEFYTQYADHAMPWSKGGAADIRECQMFCRTHNRVKGNR